MERLFIYKLQYFAEGAGGEKTEEATSKKLTDARSEGQVARSTDLITASSLLALFWTLKTFIGTIGNGFINSFIKSYNRIGVYAKDDFSPATAQGILQDTAITIIKILIPVFISAFTVAVIMNLFQVKWKLTGKPLQPKLSKINPISGFKKIFSKDKAVELIKEVIKIGVIIYVAYDSLEKNRDILLKLYDMELLQAIYLIGNIVMNLGYKISLIFLLIGFADYIYQKFKFRNDMKMTKQEVKDEYKQAEGDPQVKSKIRVKMREASQKRMMQHLPEADVVITNPTHFAAAIKYDKEISEAPILIAKGADYLAEKIKEIARENNIQIVENKPLARMLYYNVEIGNEIPPELYQMTAEVLAYVYNLNNGTLTRG
ncbi:MAG: flagellar biosynthesis protein FlhB [Anaerocolumna sp.]